MRKKAEQSDNQCKQHTCAEKNDQLVKNRKALDLIIFNHN